MLPSRRFTILAAGIMVAALLLPQLYLWPHVCDDAYISFRYLLNLGRGDGLVFNPGERVEGYSHPLWVLLLAPASFLSGAPLLIPITARIVGLACTFATGFLMIGMLRNEVAHGASLAAGIGMWIAAPGVHVYATAGLETPLLMLLLTAALFRESRTAAPPMTALLLGLAAITRPEAALHGFLWIAWRWFAQKDRRILWPAVIWLVPPVAWQAFRLAYYGDWLPNPFYAKPPGTFGGKFGIPYLAPFFIASIPPVALLGLLGSSRGQPYRHIALLAALFVLPELLLSIYSRGDWMPFGRFMVPVWGCIVFLAALGFDRIPVEGWRRAIAAASMIAAAFMALSTGLPAYIRGDGLDEIMRGDNQLAAGRWLVEHSAPDDSIAAVRLGGLAYAASDRVVLDMAGLTSREAGRHLSEHGGSINWATHPFRERQPDWIAVVRIAGGDGPPHRDEALAADLAGQYELRQTIPQGTRQIWEIYRRR